MAFIDPNEPVLASVGIPETYRSPFPASFDSERLNALGDTPAVIAKAGVRAWTDANQLALVAKAIHVGDIRSDWMTSLVKPNPEVQGAVMGIFSRVSFDASTDPADFGEKLKKTGLDMAEGLLTSIPVYGQCIGAAIGVGRWFAGLARKPEAVQEVMVPWQKYSRDSDEDIVRFVLLELMATVDWTQAFWPSLDWQNGDFRLEKGSDGDGSYVWGIFDPNGAPLYNSSAPGGGTGGSGNAGLGFMPGSQRAADVVQLKVRGIEDTPTQRVDAITEVSSFFPATTQALTSLWEMVRKAGNPDMYKVRAGQTYYAWEGYFNSMRYGFAEEWNYFFNKGNTVNGPLRLGKVVSPFMLQNGHQMDLGGYNQLLVWPGMHKKNGEWQPDPNDGRPNCVPLDQRGPGEGWWAEGWKSDVLQQAGGLWPPSRCGISINNTMMTTRWQWIDQVSTSPACKKLKEAQLSALYRTPVCAYVRPRAIQGPDGTLAAYGAFLDSSHGSTGGQTFGDELIERCEHAREALLTHSLRFKVRLEDVDAIDPVYAQRLRQSGVNMNSWKMPLGLSSGGAGLGASDPPPPNDGPSGGAPFAATFLKESPSGGGLGPLLALGAAGVAAALMGKAK
ncbi:MAG: hypothetical protein V3S01_08525 [Dehalococcoidia bacterium]